MQYLGGMCQANGFADSTFELFGATLSLKDVTVPVSVTACETDRIARWTDRDRGVQKNRLTKEDLRCLRVRPYRWQCEPDQQEKIRPFHETRSVCCRRYLDVRGRIQERLLVARMVRVAQTAGRKAGPRAGAGRYV